MSLSRYDYPPAHVWMKRACVRVNAVASKGVAPSLPGVDGPRIEGTRRSGYRVSFCVVVHERDGAVHPNTEC